MVLPPIRDSLEILEREATPFISEANTKGTAINFKRLTKITPQGFIQALVKSIQPNLLAIRP